MGFGIASLCKQQRNQLTLSNTLRNQNKPRGKMLSNTDSRSMNHREPCSTTFIFKIIYFLKFKKRKTSKTSSQPSRLKTVAPPRPSASRAPEAACAARSAEPPRWPRPRFHSSAASESLHTSLTQIFKKSK